MDHRCQCRFPRTFVGCEDYCDECGGYVDAIRGGQGRSEAEVRGDGEAVQFSCLLVLLVLVAWVVGYVGEW